MTKGILVILMVSLFTHCYSQISFEKAYFINNSSERVNCLIKNNDWKNNPTEFEYKLAEQSETKSASIKAIKEFGIDSVSKYIRSTVNIDRSSEDINKLSNSRNSIFNEEQLFLKVLVEGKVNLYEYIDANLKRYFYKNENSNIKQLSFKNYITNKGKVGSNNRFRQQLANELKCADIKKSKFESVNYEKNELTQLFVDYNKCHKYHFTNFEEKQKRDLFNLNIRPRFVNSSLSINSSLSEMRDVDFGDETNFGFGIEAEFILPFNKNKWAIIVEPTYQKLHAKKAKDVGLYFGGELTTIIDYNTIELPVGLRHYFFLNENSVFFINASGVSVINLNSSSKYISKGEDNPDPLDIKTRGNFAFGLGYKYNKRYSLELRYQTNREILDEDVTASSDYKSFSIIFGYSLF